MKKDKVSMTARKVAASIVTLGEIPEMQDVIPPGVVEATAELLVASGAVSARMVRCAHSPKMVKVYRAFDRLLPGQFEALGHRKAFCETEVRNALSAGAVQVLVLGAGYDTLAWRLAPEFPGVHFFEIDHPPTARQKAKGLAAMGERENLHLLAEDLAQTPLLDVLGRTPEWNSKAQSVVMAEGLVMYLPPPAVADLFAQCAAATGPESCIIFSYIPQGFDGRPDAGRHTGLMLWLQSVSGEPWLWSVAPPDLGSFLRGGGWSVDTVSPKRGVEFFVAAGKCRSA